MATIKFWYRKSQSCLLSPDIRFGSLDPNCLYGSENEIPFAAFLVMLTSKYYLYQKKCWLKSFVIVFVILINEEESRIDAWNYTLFTTFNFLFQH